MEKATQINISDSKVHQTSDFILISRKKGFDSISLCDVGSGFKNVENIFCTSLFTENGCKITDDEILNKSNNYTPPMTFSGPSAGIVNNTTNQNFYIKNSKDFTTIIGLEKFQKVKLSDNLEKLENYPQHMPNLDIILIIDQPLSSENLLLCFKTALEAKNFVLENLGIPLNIRNKLRSDNSIIVASTISDIPNENVVMTELLKSMNSFVTESCTSALEESGFSLGILDYIYEQGINIDDMVEAGMELCVGVEVHQALKDKLKKQILKSLEDLNVIALLMAAFQVEETFQNHRVSEVNVDDDPAYLYTDEVLGIAISNQIAGTKATFNFKRYDEEKPGIISTLGPMVDDIIAGLIAGCMSKIFEE
ncbi:MAG: alpha-ribazole phosphatase CobZ [Methanobacteriaceae archaeon]|nr:alpha-ribazole phosphatase CobZ [Methanobacteriaceae archaeon]